jgi:ribosomal protein L15
VYKRCCPWSILLFYKEGGKIYHKYIPKEKFNQIEKFANSYKVYNEKIAKLNKINKKIERHLVSWRYYTRNDVYVREELLSKNFDTIETRGR